jgi:hypothetical protein
MKKHFNKDYNEKYRAGKDKEPTERNGMMFGLKYVRITILAHMLENV